MCLLSGIYGTCDHTKCVCHMLCYSYDLSLPVTSATLQTDLDNYSACLYQIA